MSWKKLQAESKVHAHKTSKKELDELRALIARDLEDAAVQELSDDRRFATAYNAALQTAKMAIACAGYRLASTPGHHRSPSVSLDQCVPAAKRARVGDVDFPRIAARNALHRRGFA